MAFARRVGDKVEKLESSRVVLYLDGGWCAGWTTQPVVYPNGQQVLEMTLTPST